MQIRLTVVDPLGPPDRARGRATSCDVLVTAPAGTALSAVASALAAAVSGDPGTGQPERGREPGGQAVLYAGAERLDGGRCTLGEPPLIDGAVLSLGAPAEPEPHPELDDAPTQLHVVAGPDAGGVHLLHGGQIHIGRSADADVPLDDPDVSRLHCAVTVAADGRVSVADLDSTNGTTLDGTRVGTRPVRFPPGALLRIGESVLRLSPSGGRRLDTEPDGEGYVRVPSGEAGLMTGDQQAPGGSDTARTGRAGYAPGASGAHQGSQAAGGSVGGGQGPSGTGARRGSETTPYPSDAVEKSAAAGAREDGTGASRSAPGQAGRPPRARGGVSAGATGDRSGRSAPSADAGPADGSIRTREGRGDTSPRSPTDRTHHTYGSAGWGASGGGPEGTAAQGHGPAEPPAVVPGQGGAPRIEHRDGTGGGRQDVDDRLRGATGAVSDDPGHGHGGASGRRCERRGCPRSGRRRPGPWARGGSRRGPSRRPVRDRLLRSDTHPRGPAASRDRPGPALGTRRPGDRPPQGHPPARNRRT